MQFSIRRSAGIFLLLFCVSFMLQGQQNGREPYHRLVDPFIGTGGHGHTFPGATAPFGFVQLSPDTRLTGWDGCSGYHYSDSVIYGFSHTHLSGTGVSDYGDVLIMPAVGLPFLDEYRFASSFDKATERAEAGYYEVFLRQPRVRAELTATPRTGMHRYTFTAGNKGYLALDLPHRDKVIESSLDFVSPTEVVGMRRSEAWATDQVVYFCIQFSRPFRECGTYSGGRWVGGIREISSTDIRSYFIFDTDPSDPVIVKVGLSAVDVEGARRNIQAENPGWDFDAVRKATQASWDRELGKIEVSGGSPAQMKTFYTALYHCMIAPNLFSDADGRYRGMDKRIHHAQGHQQYTVFSLWDTYRALHPLMTIIDQQRTTDFIRTFLNHYEQGGLLPVWELAANETFCMIGYHSASVITDAWMKGIRGFDASAALKAMVHSATRDHFGLRQYIADGYIAGDKEHESVSKTLEYAYDDWCIAQLAGDLGHQDVYTRFMERSQYYKNLFDPATGCMRPRLNGAWKTPFNPAEVDFHFTEANSWQYSFYAPHDVAGLIRLHGGEEAFGRQLDQLFTAESALVGRQQADITGMIGQYAHGNEPSHHMAYLYNYIGQPWKTQQRIRQILDEQYSEQPDGLSGNEDCGQMSAWYVLSALGIYPVCPGNPEYALTTPLFPEARIHLENGSTWVIRRKGDPSAVYTTGIKVNGKSYGHSYLKHADIMKGGEIVFETSGTASREWAAKKADRPVSSVETTPVTIVPVFSRGARTFSQDTVVSIAAIQPDAEIEYRIQEEGRAATDWTPYKEPVPINTSLVLTARARSARGVLSKETTARYHRFDSDWKITLLSTYNPQYTAGGPEGLIDGLRGEQNWRLGGWQGYQGQDFEAVIDLGKSRKISEIGAGFCQDVRSWIWLPVKAEFFISEDGQRYEKLAMVAHDVSPEDYELSARDLSVKVKAQGRYLKVRATNYGRIPDWHLGAGGQAFIFIDEIWTR